MNKLVKFSKIVFFISWIFVSACTPTSRDYVNCDQVKKEFLKYVNDNIDDIISIIEREYSRKEGDEEITGQRILDGISSFSFSQQWSEYEDILKNNCPETYKKFQDELGLIIIKAIANKYGN